MKFAINSGHTEVESGSTSISGFKEFYYTTELSKLVYNKLISLGYNTVQIRDYALSKIVNNANKLEVTALLSLHCNYSDDITKKGVIIHCRSPKGSGERISECIKHKFLEIPWIENVEIVYSPTYYILKYTECPTIILKVAYISNKEEEIFFQENMELYASAITNGLLCYIKK